MRFFILTLICSTVSALPSGPSIREGDVHIRFDDRLTEIRTGSFAELHWENFSIEPNEVVRFLQEDAHSIAINRVVTSAPSKLLGQLTANGQIMLLNPNGILVGENAFIDTGAWIASTLDQFQKCDSEWHFAGDSTATIVNEGTIRSSGDIVQLARHIENRGKLESVNALVGAGKEIFYRPNAKEKLLVRLSAEDLFEGVGIDNSGTVIAKHAELKADGNLYAYAIKHSGDIDALGVEEVDGEIWLVAEDGYVQISGTLHAKKIDALGKRLALIDEAQIEAPAGNVHIEGEYAYVGKDAKIFADAKLSGDGGKVVIWGSDVSAMYGSISARGGAQSGNGGFVEISSPKGLFAKGPVDTRAPFGNNGTLLFDPCVVTISTAATTGSVTPTSPPPACPLPVQSYDFAALAAANILNTDIIGYLACNHVTIDASASGSAGTGSITLSAGAGTISWTAATKLTLIADGFIQIDNRIACTALVSATTALVELSAPVVQIGPSASAAEIGMLSGQVIINSPTSLSLFSSAPAGTRKGIITGASGDPSTIVIRTGSLLLDATTAPFVITAGSGIDIIATGNIDLHGGSAATDGEAQIVSTAGGDLSIVGFGNLSLQGGDSATSGGAAIANFFGGNLSVTITGDISLNGGNGPTDGVAGIALQGAAGSVQVSGRNILLNAGTATAVIGNFAAIGAVIGGVGLTTVTSTGPAGITLNANGSNLALIGSPPAFGGSGGATVNTTHLNLNASTTAGAIMGHAQVISTGGNVIVSATGDIIAVGGAGMTDNVARIIAGAGGGSVTVRARNISLFGGTSSTTNAVILSEFGSVDCAISGDYLFQGGTGLNSSAGISSANLGGSGDLVISGRNYTFIGGSGTFAAAACIIGNLMGGGDGSLSLTATGSVTMTGGSAPFAAALISTNGPALTNSLSMQVGSNLTMTSGAAAEASISTLGGPISITAGNDVTMMSTAIDATIFILAGNSDLFVQAGRNLSVNSLIFHAGGGNIILVVDADFPQPFFGPGSFALGPASTVTTTTGAIRIFTSQQQLNSILGTINGLTFTPGALFLDTAQEIWCVYFPSFLGGFPFTIFYKECLQLLAFQAQVIEAESLENLHPYNAFPGWWARFSLSSNLVGDEFHIPYYLTRRFSPTFWLPKSYTGILHDEF